MQIPNEKAKAILKTLESIPRVNWHEDKIVEDQIAYLKTKLREAEVINK